MKKNRRLVNIEKKSENCYDLIDFYYFCRLKIYVPIFN